MYYVVGADIAITLSRVLDRLSKPVDLGFNRSRVRVNVGLLPANQKLCRNAAGVTEYNFL